MRIMTILGSPRRQGNTAKVLGWIEEQFQADGHEVDSANILDYRVQGCGECMACKKGTVELCSIGDDANGLFQRMAAADLVLIAAPVFCWALLVTEANEHLISDADRAEWDAAVLEYRAKYGNEQGADEGNEWF